MSDGYLGPFESTSHFAERACEAATYDVYGITTMESGKFTGVNRLKGPGVATDVYGVTQMGGRTPHRFTDIRYLFLNAWQMDR